MIRIVNYPKKKTPEPVRELTAKDKALLRILGIVVMERPDRIWELLDDYGIELEKEADQKTLTEQLMEAIAQNDNEFNQDLAALILDHSLDSDYDSFDFKSLFSKKEDAPADTSATASPNVGGGLWAGVASAVGSVSATIGQGIKGKQSRDQATAATLQSVYAYKAQQAASAQNKGKNKSLLLLGLFILVGIAIIAVVISRKKAVPIPSPQKV